MAIIDFFDRGWRANPRGTAYVMDDQTWTYQEAGELSCRLAQCLVELGLETGARGAVLAPNDPTAWICVLGLWRANLAWVPLNPAYPLSANEQILSDFNCEVVFFHPDLAPAGAELRRRLPAVRHWIDIDTVGELVAGRPATRPLVTSAMDDVIAVSPTGGTTGTPKGVMNTHRSLSTGLAHLLLATDYPAGAPIVNLAAAPMTHTSGVVSLACSARGGTVVVLRRAQPDALLDAIEHHGVTEVFLPPTVIYRLLDLPGIAARDLSSLRFLFYGSAPMATGKLRRALAVFGPILLEGYGQTEAPLAIAFQRPAEHFVDGEIAPDTRLASCGRPGPLVTVEILDPDGRPLEAGETGEICVRGDLVMKGYHDNPELTAETIRDGWLHTGDAGHLDDDGYLHITDRLKDMVISGGFNIYPRPIEAVIAAHPGVADCAVIGLPHDDWGEAVTAVVAVASGAEVSAEELMARCRVELGSLHTPKRVEFVDALPLSPYGKVLKRELRRRFTAEAGAR